MSPLDPHLFRHEWARLVAALVRVFGVHNLELAEDVAQDTLFRAMELWKQAGVPEHPSAWLTTVAKRRAIDELRRARKQALAAPELARFLESEWTRTATVDELFAPQPLHDDELRLMFSLAQPRLPEASQLALVLQLACGFSDAEIASALITSTAAVTKRLQRAKEVVRGSRSLYELADGDLPERLASVRRAIYLMFNEGYHAASPESVVRGEFCEEAVRLGPRTRGPARPRRSRSPRSFTCTSRDSRRGSTRAANRSPSPSSRATAGTPRSSHAGSRCSARRLRATRSPPSTWRRRSRPATRPRPRTRRRRGRGSSRCTTRWSRWRRRRWSR